MVKIGIVGLPNAGKSTLFNALVSQNKALVGVYPFTTIDKNLGVVAVPDESLLKLARLENISKITPVTIEFVDIAGLIKGAHQGEGLGNQFLHHIREVDLILHLVRLFKNKDVPHVHPAIDPDEDLEIVNEELIFADIQSLKKQADSEKLTEEAKALVKRLISELDKGIPAYKISLTDKEAALAKAFNLLTNKGQLVVANIDEADIGKDKVEIGGQPVLPICAKLEAELAELPQTDREKFLKEYGLVSPARDTIILESYLALNLITFYTIAKHQEARAWTLRQGKNALEAASKVHTDFAKYFVKVEQINVQELLRLGGWHKAQAAGKILTHGKDYLVKDGDVLEFKVSIK